VTRLDDSRRAISISISTLISSRWQHCLKPP